MKVCGGYFTGSVEIFDGCFCGEVCFYTAYHVVRAWSDGDEVLGSIDIEAFAQFVDEGESFCEMLFVEVPYVEVDMSCVCFEHLF